jgi:hypothetical protein
MDYTFQSHVFLLAVSSLYYLKTLIIKGGITPMDDKVMTNVLIPQHIFISYSHDDMGLAKKIISDLREAGIALWVDHEGLTPGNPNWEWTLRDAIAHSFAVILLASPNSRTSVVVQGELNLAISLGCLIVPIWIGGGEWADSIQLSMFNTQYIDCRNEKYDYGLSQLVEAIEKIIDARLPKHFLITSKEWQEYWRLHKSITLPGNYIRISLKGGHLSNKAYRDTVFLKISANQSLRSLLDDLYLGYLSKRFEPFTYGQDWILGEDGWFYQYHRLIVPERWLLKHENLPLSNFIPSWDTHPLSTYGLDSGTELAIINKLPLISYGVATNNDYLGSLIRDRFDIKRGIVLYNLFSSMARSNQCLYEGFTRFGGEVKIEMHKAAEVNLADFKFTVIFTSKESSMNNFIFIIN